MKNLKSNLQGLLRAVIFIFAFVLIFIWLSSIFVPMDNNNSDQTLYSYRAEAKDSVDVVFVGNSDLYRGISPLDFYNQTGITAVCAGVPSMKEIDAVECVEDIFNYQHPKAVVLEVDYTYKKYTPKDGAEIKKASKPTNNSKTSKKADSKIIAKVKKISEKPRAEVKKVKSFITSFDTRAITRLSYKYPLLKTHNNWDSMEKRYFKGNQYNELKSKGFLISKKVKPYKKRFSYMKKDQDIELKVDDKTLESFNKINDICKEHNAELIFLEVPSASSWSNSKHAVVEGIANDLGIKFYDYNVTVPDGFNWKKHTKDSGNHLNYQGASIVTKRFSTDFQTDFKLDKSDLPADLKEEWDNDYLEFKNYVDVIDKEEKDKYNKTLDEDEALNSNPYFAVDCDE